MREKIRRLLRRRLVALLLVVTGLTVLTFVISNFILAGKVADELSERTGLEWRVARASWSPWGGIRLKGLSAGLTVDNDPLPAPLCEVQAVRIDPYWRTLLGGRPRFRRVDVVGPRGDLPVEVIAELARTAGVPVEPTHDLSLPPPQDPPAPKKERVKHQRDRPPGATGARKDRKKRAAAKEEKKPPPTPSTETKPAKAERESRPSRVRISDGSMRVYSLRNPGIEFSFSGFECDLPVAGPEAEGSLSFSGMRLSGNPLLPPLQGRAVWDGKELRFKESIRTEVGIEFATAVHVLPGRRPRFGFVTEVTNASLPIHELARIPGIQFGIERINAAYLRGGGALLQPRSWQVDLVLDTRGVLVGNPRLGGLQRFDFGQAVATMRQGVVRVPDARLRSERLSFLGNGLILPDGRHWSVLRVVADEEYARAIRRVLIGSNLTQGWTSAWMRPLVTPDRRYRDIHVSGKLPDAMLDLGRKGERISFKEVVGSLRRFLENETDEESGLGETQAQF